MAVEAKRGCGFRIVGGLYIVCDATFLPCDRLTFEIPEVCPCCGNGTKFSRGWTWVDPVKFFGGDHLLFRNEGDLLPEIPCDCVGGNCPVCRPALMGERAAILWIGERHYSPAEFVEEANKLGVSRRIPAVPRDLVIGETWILCAHLKAITREVPADNGENGDLFEEKHFPGVFFAFRPRRLERIVKQSDFDLYQRVERMSEEDREKWLSGSRSVKERVDNLFRPGNDRINREIETYKQMARDAGRGITFVPVPDDDPDHNPEVRK